MALLLAKKLTNQVIRLAEQVGLTLEVDLVNFYNDGERKAVGCKGTIRNAQTGKHVAVRSSESCPNLVGLELAAVPDDIYSLANAADAADEIISLLTPAPLTHDNLAKSRISNLPDLDKNPLLDAYLSDASTSTATWTAGRIMLEHTILSQGFSRNCYTRYPPYGGDAENSIASGLWYALAQSCEEDNMVCHHLLAYHDVCPSETVKGRLAYYQDDAKRKAGIRTPVKVRKYLQKFFKDFRSPGSLEQIAKTLDGLLQTPDDWDVRLYSDDSLDGWADAYYHVGSCMNTQHKNYGVGEHETYRCYCTSAMTGGAKSSGLTLAVLYQDNKPVARTLTYTTDDGKFYMRNYGDDRLVKWLDNKGYTHRNWLPKGTHLWTEIYDVDRKAYLSPYVDGDDRCDAKATIIYENGQPYWVIGSDGAVLQNCCGYTCFSETLCDCCSDAITNGDEYHRTDMDGNEVTLCYVCDDAYCWTVDEVPYIYVRESDLSDLIHAHANCYYTQEYLDNHDLVLTGDRDTIYIDYAEQCEFSGEFYDKSDFTDLSREPEFVRDTWAGYINEHNLVRTYLYRRDGMYITELDCYVHETHVSAVRARLESEA